MLIKTLDDAEAQINNLEARLAALASRESQPFVNSRYKNEYRGLMVGIASAINERLGGSMAIPDDPPIAAQPLPVDMSHNAGYMFVVSENGPFFSVMADNVASFRSAIAALR